MNDVQLNELRNAMKTDEAFLQILLFNQALIKFTTGHWRVLTMKESLAYHLDGGVRLPDCVIKLHGGV